MPAAASARIASGMPTIKAMRPPPPRRRRWPVRIRTGLCANVESPPSTGDRSSRDSKLVAGIGVLHDPRIERPKRRFFSEVPLIATFVEPGLKYGAALL